MYASALFDVATVAKMRPYKLHRAQLGAQEVSVCGVYTYLFVSFSLCCTLILTLLRFSTVIGECQHQCRVSQGGAYG